MKDRDVDTHLKQFLAGDPAKDAFKQQVLQDSTAEFLRVQRHHSVWRFTGLAIAAMLMIGAAFWAGRVSTPSKMPETGEPQPLAVSGSNSVVVPEDLIAWLDAARLFGQLGMKDRMAHAVERAGRLLPADAVVRDQARQGHIAVRSVAKRNKPIEPTDLPGPHPSAEGIHQILAHSLGD